MSDLDENVASRAPDDPGDTIFTPTIDPQSKINTNSFPLDNIDLNDVSNEDLMRLGETSPIIYQISENKVVRLSRSLAMKCGPTTLASEAEALKFVREKTTKVLVPRVYRSFQIDDPSQYFGTRGYYVMDYIDGDNLGDCWKRLSKDEKVDVIRQTRDIIQELQSIECSTVGPFGGGKCQGHLFTDYAAGPFDSRSDMEAWFNHKLAVCRRFNQAPKDMPSFKFEKFVLVHQDISPRNMILDASRRVWLIDWAFAGAYPPAFERGALAWQYRFPEFNKMLLEAIPKFDFEEQQLRSIGYGLTVAAYA